MSGWHLLDHELDAWEALGRHATLWLRDDDACSDSPALRRLLGIASDYRLPVAVAAIPSATDATLADAIARFDDATIVQHGYAHHNYAAAGERSAEFGGEREIGVRLDELERGRETLARWFGDRFVAVLVPPWNRIGEDLLPHLPSAGFPALSRFGPRSQPSPVPGLLQVNAHVDPIAWRRERQFIGVDAAIERLAAHLRARRQRQCDADEPTGVLTHHLAFTDVMWEFLEALVTRTRNHGAVAWLDVKESFGAPAPPITSSRSA